MSSLGSIISEELEDMYPSSVNLIDVAKDQDELIDKDLLDLLCFIKTI